MFDQVSRLEKMTRIELILQESLDRSRDYALTRNPSARQQIGQAALYEIAPGWLGEDYTLGCAGHEAHFGIDPAIGGKREVFFLIKEAPPIHVAQCLFGKRAKIQSHLTAAGILTWLSIHAGCEALFSDKSGPIIWNNQKWPRRVKVDPTFAIAEPSA